MRRLNNPLWLYDFSHSKFSLKSVFVKVAFRSNVLFPMFSLSFIWRSLFGNEASHLISSYCNTPRAFLRNAVWVTNQLITFYPIACEVYSLRLQFRIIAVPQWCNGAEDNSTWWIRRQVQSRQLSFYRMPHLQDDIQSHEEQCPTKTIFFLGAARGDT